MFDNLIYASEESFTAVFGKTGHEEIGERFGI